MPSSGRTIASIFHRLQLTLFHAGRVDSHTRPAARPPVSVTGWTATPAGFAGAARRYVAQVDLSLRPSTVKHIEHDLREFGTWLGQVAPDVDSCADLTRTPSRTTRRGSPPSTAVTPADRSTRSA